MEAKERPILIKPDPDDSLSLLEQQEFIEKEIEKDKHQILTEFGMRGEKYLTEIDKKKIRWDNEKKRCFKYISKHTKEYTYDEIMSYDISDVRKIYKELKTENEWFITKFFRFIFNI